MLNRYIPPNNLRAVIHTSRFIGAHAASDQCYPTNHLIGQGIKLLKTDKILIFKQNSTQPIFILSKTAKNAWTGWSAWWTSASNSVASAEFSCIVLLCVASDGWLKWKHQTHSNVKIVLFGTSLSRNRMGWTLRNALIVKQYLFKCNGLSLYPSLSLLPRFRKRMKTIQWAITTAGQSHYKCNPLHTITYSIVLKSR